MKTITSSLAPIVAVSFLFAFSANKKIQADSGTALDLETDFCASKKSIKNKKLLYKTDHLVDENFVKQLL